MSLSALDIRCGALFMYWNIFNLFIGALLGGSAAAALRALLEGKWSESPGALGGPRCACSASGVGASCIISMPVGLLRLLCLGPAHARGAQHNSAVALLTLPCHFLTPFSSPADDFLNILGAALPASSSFFVNYGEGPALDAGQNLGGAARTTLCFPAVCARCSALLPCVPGRALHCAAGLM